MIQVCKDLSLDDQIRERLGIELDRLLDRFQRIAESAGARENLPAKRVGLRQFRIEREGKVEIAQRASRLGVGLSRGPQDERLGVDRLEQHLRDELRFGSKAKQNAALGDRFAERLAGFIEHLDRRAVSQMQLLQQGVGLEWLI